MYMKGVGLFVACRENSEESWGVIRCEEDPVGCWEGVKRCGV